MSQQMPYIPLRPAPTVESLQKRIDDLEDFILTWLTHVVNTQNVTLDMAVKSNNAVNQILTRIDEVTPVPPQKVM